MTISRCQIRPSSTPPLMSIDESPQAAEQVQVAPWQCRAAAKVESRRHWNRRLPTSQPIPACPQHSAPVLVSTLGTVMPAAQGSQGALHW